MAKYDVFGARWVREEFSIEVEADSMSEANRIARQAAQALNPSEYGTYWQSAIDTTAVPKTGVMRANRIDEELKE